MSIHNSKRAELAAGYTFPKAKKGTLVNLASLLARIPGLENSHQKWNCALEKAAQKAAKKCVMAASKNLKDVSETFFNVTSTKEVSDARPVNQQ